MMRCLNLFRKITFVEGVPIDVETLINPSIRNLVGIELNARA